VFRLSNSQGACALARELAGSRWPKLGQRLVTDGSVTHWIGQVKEGGESVAERELWDHYFSRLAALARQKLRGLPPHLCDDEDLALSALNSFFIRAKQDGFPHLHDRTDLWQLLAKITVRKTFHRHQNAHAQKRGGGQVQANSDFVEDLHKIAASEPTPDMLVIFNEEYQKLMGVLDEELQHVARFKLEGYTNAEIAIAIGRVERTVERKLDHIRKIWALGGDVP
jgi:DNA-directed RNA polymerase specialized sigma24 family protein